MGSSPRQHDGHDLLQLRLQNQHLAGTTFRTAASVVGWLGAVQSQDYPAAKWGIGLRARTLTDEHIDRAFDSGAILRTHVMRPTWHFVTPADIRWLLALTAPRVLAITRHYERKFELDDSVFRKSRRVFERVLQGTQLTRRELATALHRARINIDGLRPVFIVMHAELTGLICSGRRQNKAFTYALLDERVPEANARTRDEGLAELTRRYFTSHGPATLKDYAWWSGLTVRDARRGVDLVGRALTQARAGDLTYWFAPGPLSRSAGLSATHLLPNYDEFLVAYKDRGLVTPPGSRDRTLHQNPFTNHLLVNGQLAGTWTRTRNARGVSVRIAPFQRLERRDATAVADAVERYGRFMQIAVTSVVG